jgi:hypothetical protein
MQLKQRAEQRERKRRRRRDMGANRSNTDLTNPSATPRKPRSIDTYVYICIHRAFYTLASSTSTWVISFLALGYIKYSVSFINKKDPTWNCFSARTFFRFFLSLSFCRRIGHFPLCPMGNDGKIRDGHC